MAFSGSNPLQAPTKDYYKIMWQTRTATQADFNRFFAEFRTLELREMPNAIESGQAKPETGVVYVKPGKDSLHYVTALTPIFNNKPQLQVLTKEELEEKAPLSFDKIKAAEAQVLKLVLAKKHIYPPIDCGSSQAELREAHTVLSDSVKRKAYDDLLDAYFQEIYTAVKDKNIPLLQQQLSAGIGLAVRNNQKQSLVKRLEVEHDAASFKFLVTHFRPHFSTAELAFMGAEDLTKEEMEPNVYEVASEYARGNHIAQMNRMLVLLPKWKLYTDAVYGYVLGGNAVEAEKMMALGQADKTADMLHCLKGALKEAGCLQDPVKLQQFLAPASKAFKDAANYVANSTEDYFPNVPLNGQVPAEEKSQPQGPSPAKIFDDLIAEVQAMAVNDPKSKKDFVAALSALKRKALNDQQAHPIDAMALATAAQTLVQDIKHPGRRGFAVSTFEINTQAFKTTWDWKMVLGAVIGFAIGFIIGAMIGAAAAPAAAATALGAGVVGAWIGASLFAAGGTLALGTLGRKLAQHQDPIQQTIETAAVMRNNLSGG